MDRVAELWWCVLRAVSRCGQRKTGIGKGLAQAVAVVDAALPRLFGLGRRGDTDLLPRRDIASFPVSDQSGQIVRSHRSDGLRGIIAGTAKPAVAQPFEIEHGAAEHCPCLHALAKTVGA